VAVVAGAVAGVRAVVLMAMAMVTATATAMAVAVTFAGAQVGMVACMARACGT
jgi:hypothetical protein